MSIRLLKYPALAIDRAIAWLDPRATDRASRTGRVILLLIAAFVSAGCIEAHGQAAIQTFPPNTVFGRIGVGQFGPGGAVPLSTLAANLGFATPAHTVPIGKGSTAGGFNYAGTGNSGWVLVDQGSGNDPAFVPISGSCSLAANGAMSCSGVGAGVTLVNASSNASYTMQTSDCLKTIAVFGGTQATLTVNSAATYGACTVDIANTNSWTSPAGVVLNVTGLTTDPPVLYPGMSITLLNVNGVWFQKPGVGISQAPVGTKLYVDGVNGSDGNDCLSTATACQTLNWVFMHVIWQSLVASSGSGTGSSAGFDVRLIADPACAPSTGVNCIHGLHYSGAPKQVEGHNSIMIECDSGSATNCTIADNTGNQAIGVYCACFLELKNVTLASGNGNNNDVQVEKGMIRLEGGVVLGGVPLNQVAQLSALNHGTIVLEGGAGTQVSGGANWLAQSQSGGVIQLDQHTIQWIANSTYGGATLAAFNGTVTAAGTVWGALGGVTVSATAKLQCSTGGVIDTNGGLANVPGSVTQIGCTNSVNGTYN